MTKALKKNTVHNIFHKVSSYMKDHYKISLIFVHVSWLKINIKISIVFLCKLNKKYNSSRGLSTR